MKRLIAALFVLFAAVAFGVPTSAQAPNTQPAGCIYYPSPTPAPPVGSAVLTLRCASDGTLQTTAGGGGGGGNVTIVGPLGTNTKAASVSITIASDQGAIPVSGTVSITGAVAVNTPAPAPTGAHGAVIVEGVASGTVVPISGTVTANAGTGSFTVTGTVTANAGTGNFSILPPLTGVSGTGTAQAVNQAIVAGCAFNSSLPTITTGNVGPQQCDTGGRALVVGAGTAGSAAGGVVTVQGVASGTNLNVAVAAALPAGANTIGAVTQASGPWTITPPLTGVSGTGTAQAVAQAMVESCAFNSSAPTITTGNVGPGQCNTRGERQVDMVSVGGVLLGATANYGTSPGAVKVQGVNSFVTNTVAITPPLTGANGTGTAGAAAQAVVAACNFTTAPATLTTGNVGPLTCDSTGGLILGTGSKTIGAVTQASGPWTITPPLTGANGTGTVGAAAQALVASCNFTTAPATLTSGNVGPINCDNKGNQIVAGSGTAGTAAGGVLTVQGVASMTALAVTPPLTGVSGTGTTAAVAQTMVAGCNFASSLPTITNGNVGPVQCDNKGQQFVDVNYWAATTLGAPTAVGTVASGNVITVNAINAASTAGGATQANFVNLAGTVQAIKASAGTLYAVQMWNGTGATAFGQIFNVATGSVTLGTTVPDLQFACPTLTYCFAPIPSTIGVNFATAISVASTTTVSGASGSASGVYLYAQYK